MNYTFNKKLIEQVKAGTHCIEFNREKDSLEMLQALCKEAWPKDSSIPVGDCNFYFSGPDIQYWHAWNKTDKTPIPLSNFVQPEQSERDVMSELDERLKRLEDILLRDAEVCKAEPEPVNPVRWRSERNNEYYYVSEELDTETGIERLDKFDDKRYAVGNYFQTTQQSEEMAVLMQFTLNNPELVKQLMDKKE